MWLGSVNVAMEINFQWTSFDTLSFVSYTEGIDKRLAEQISSVHNATS